RVRRPQFRINLRTVEAALHAWYASTPKWKHMLPGIGMPITLRNKAVEERIRAIGKRTGEGPSAVIARAISNEEERLRAEDEALKAKRVAAMKRLRAALPKLTDEDRRAIKQAMEDIYDEYGLPK
ncbi:MAG TPA: type II toxin-antitoxin system VapB family antitoxin, partial [Bradyrhizobium sp.]|nr:type II toxin-antitoxin system VapB family antitoxin [Bradyrhizobium sp.]